MKILFKIIKAESGSDVYYKTLEQGLKTQGIEVETCYYPKIFQFFPFFLKFIDKEITADIIHSNIEYGWVFKRKNIPLVVTVFHLVYDKEYQKTTSLFQKIYHYLILKPNIQKTLDNADKIIAISRYTKKSIYNYFKTKKEISVIYCGIDFSVFKPIKFKKHNDEKFHLLFVGNLIKRKGADLLPKIMRLLGNNYVLHYTSGLRTKPLNNFNLPNMIPLGKLSEEELVKKYNECDALLAPSRLEGFGYQIAEAMACGKPVVATNYSSMPELIRNGENGFLCKLNNVDDFVKKIRKLKESMAFQHKFRINNKRRIKSEFSLKKLLKTYTKEYQDLHNS